MKDTKIGIIGAGDIGFNLAEILSLQGYSVIIYNRYHEVDNHPSPYWLGKMGKVMDLTDALQLPTCGDIVLTSELEHLNGCSYIVITSGAKRSSIDETREDLAARNARIMKGYVELIAANPHSLVMIITNPVDFLANFLVREVAAYTKQTTKLISQQIIGVSYVDTMRLKNLVKDFMRNKHPDLGRVKVECLVLGEHGPAMVPLMSSVRVNGQTLDNFASDEEITQLKEQTILRGNDIIKLTGASSTKGPAHAAMHMITKIDQNDSVNLPCSFFDGKRAVGNLVDFASRKVEGVLEIKLTRSEEQEFAKAVKSLDAQYNTISEILRKS